MTRVRPEHSCPGNDSFVSEDELQAYVDGQLASRRRAAIESYLAGRPDEAARLAAYRAQNIGLHALFDPRPGRPRRDDALPPRLAALAGALDAKLADEHRPAADSRRLRSLAASIALLITAGTAGWLAIDQLGPRDGSLVALTRQASEAPVQPVAQVSSVAAQDSERQVVAWLAAQPGDVPATVPDLEGLGFRLMGEKLLPAAGGPPAAQLRYEDAAGQQVTLTMRSGGKAGQTSFTYARDGDSSRFVWQDAHISYSLVGRMAQDKLLEIAEAVSERLQENAEPTATQEAAQAPVEAAGGDAGAAAVPAPLEPATPGAKPAPLIDKSPLIPVPVPDNGAPKET